MRILVDLDGTCADLHTPWLQEFAWATGIRIEPSQMNRWEWYEELLVREQKKLFSVLTPKLYQYLNPMPWMRLSLAELVTEGHEVVVVTARAPQFHVVTMEWIEREMPFVREANVVFTKRKDLVVGNLLIDDKAEYSNRNLHAAFLCYDQPWNQWYTGPRLRYWDALPALVRSLNIG